MYIRSWAMSSMYICVAYTVGYPQVTTRHAHTSQVCMICALYSTVVHMHLIRTTLSGNVEFIRMTGDLMKPGPASSEPSWMAPSPQTNFINQP